MKFEAVLFEVMRAVTINYKLTCLALSRYLRWRSTANYNESLAFSIQYILSIQPNKQANSFHIVYQLMHCQHSEFQNDTKLQVKEASLIRKAMCHYPYVKLHKARATKTLKTSS